MQTPKIILSLCSVAALSAMVACTTATATENEASENKEIKSGEIWPDNNGVHINAHGGGLLAYGDKYYWFGEHKSDSTSSALVGVTCYSSPNLVDWTDCGTALSVVDTKGHDLERGCVLERPKVVYNPLTGKFVMWFHLELKGKGYSAARYGVAVADKPEGPYTYLRSGRVLPGILPAGMTAEEAAKADSLSRADLGDWWTDSWREAVKDGYMNSRDLTTGQMARDQTVFVDPSDGKAYHIFSSEENLTLVIAELSEDFTSHTGKYVRVAPGEQNEAPAIFLHGDTYWMITSGCTGWAPNKARMYSSKSIWGPWTRHENPCVGPNADLTFGGQSTYIFNVPGTDNYVFMADIWRPEHPSDARYIWLPITWSDGKPEIRWRDSWTLADVKN